MNGVQVTWFFVPCLARWEQGLGLSTLELTTFAMILSTLNSLFFWYHKPLDVQVPITLRMERSITEILKDAGDRAREPYSYAPLDFLKAPPVSTSIVAPFWFGVGVVIDLDQESNSRPTKRFGNSKTRSPKGIAFRETMYRILFEAVYFGVHLVSWNLHSPTWVELMLWRTSILILLGLLALYLVIIPIGVVSARPFSRRWLKKKVNSPLEVAAQLPQWAQSLLHVPILAIYLAARSYILLEGLISLRALPLDAYVDVHWPNFVPHV